MPERNTGIRASQIRNLTILAEDLKDSSIETAKIKDGNVTGIKLNSDVVDNFTMKLSNNKLKIADRIELNTMLNAFRIAVNGALTQENMVDGIVDEYEDETGIDTVNSLNESYDAVNNLYIPSSVVGLELDYMEYANDAAAQAAYVSSDPSAVEAITNQQTLAADASALGNFGGSRYRMPEKLILAKKTIITQLKVTFGANYGTPTGQVTYRIETDSAGFPSGTLAHADATLAITPTPSAENTINFTDFLLDLGTYWIVPVIADQTLGNGWQPNMYLTSGSSEYLVQSTDGGATYQTYNSNNYTLTFKIYGKVIHTQSYSEATIINQGTYSLKGFAVATDSLNDTLTKSGLTLDLSNKNTLNLDVYASRTGTNLQVQLIDKQTTYGSDILTGGTATADTTYGAFVPARAADDNTGNYWLSTNTAFPHWWKYNLGVGITKTVEKLRIYGSNANMPKNFTLQGSNDDSVWDILLTDIYANLGGWQEFTFANAIAYRYYKINMTDNNGVDSYSMLWEVEMMELNTLTSTKNILINTINTWETTTWDISAIANADKDSITKIIFKILNADADNTFYIDNMYVPGATNNMTLFSNANTAVAQPTNARIVLFEEDVDAITLQTDLQVYVSRDGGTTWTQVTLADEGNYGSGKRILSNTVDISAQPAGTSMKYKILTLNSKALKIHGTSLTWN